MLSKAARQKTDVVRIAKADRDWCAPPATSRHLPPATSRRARLPRACRYEWELVHARQALAEAEQRLEKLQTLQTAVHATLPTVGLAVPCRTA